MANFPNRFMLFTGQITQNPLDNILHIADAATDINIFQALKYLFVMIQRHAQRPFGVDTQTANIFDGAVDEFFIR